MDDVAEVFKALADPTRRQILEDLQGGELSAGEIVSRFAISAPSISRHLGVLKGAGLVTERRVANRIFYALVAERLALCVGSFLSKVCPEQVLLRHRRSSGSVKAKGGQK
jgi:DNA-binding transcriptional ArsR family regulator